MNNQFIEIGSDFLINTSEISYVDFYRNEEDGERSQMYIVMKNGKKFTIESNIDGIYKDIKTALGVEWW